jgi:hypothetical protein
VRAVLKWFLDEPVRFKHICAYNHKGRHRRLGERTVAQMTARSIADIGTSPTLDLIAQRVLCLALDVKLHCLVLPSGTQNKYQWGIVNSAGSREVFSCLSGNRNAAHSSRIDDPMKVASRTLHNCRPARRAKRFRLHADSNPKAWLDVQHGTWRIGTQREKPLTGDLAVTRTGMVCRL